MFLKEHTVAFPSKETMKICWDDNDDGAGFAWYDKETDMWKVVKGLMSWTAFENRFDKDRKKYKLDEKMVVVHFRVGTTGPRNGGATHPFPFIDVTDDNLFALEYESKALLFHNGTLCAGNAQMSDTAMAARDYSPMTPHLFETGECDKGLLPILEEVLVSKTCRYVITHSNRAIMLGPWVHDKETDLHWSNERYVFEKTAAGKREAALKNIPTHVHNSPPSTRSLFEVDLPEKWQNKSAFLMGGTWSWDKWDGRWNTNSTAERVTNTVKFYDINGKVTHEYDPWDNSDVKEQQKPIICMSCNMEIRDITWLNDGECPGCGTLLMPEQDNNNWEYTDADIYVCPTCDETSMIVDVPDRILSTTMKKGLEDFTKCGKCECVWGYNARKEPWIIGYHDQKAGTLVEMHNYSDYKKVG
jgi:predicted RNA-binding Zn-ribbon protein involved in translation (DUF1610 family)